MRMHSQSRRSAWITFFLGADQVRRITRNSADKMSTKQLKRKLKTAGLPVKGNREELVSRYDKFRRGTLAEEGMSSPPEGEDEGTRAADNPAVVMTDESTGDRYMRLVDSKGLRKTRQIHGLSRISMMTLNHGEDQGR